MKKTKYSLFLITFIMLLLLTLWGCSKTSSQFNDNYEQFKQSYLVATEFVEKDNDLLKALGYIDVNSMSKEMETMKKSLEQMNTSLNTKDEKGIYSNVTSYYQELEYILYAAKNKDNLTTDEKRKAFESAFSASMTRDSIKKGEI